MPMARSSVVKIRRKSDGRSRGLFMAPSLRNLLRTRDEPCVICRLRDNAHVRLHACMAGAANLRAEDGVKAFANWREVDVQGRAGHCVLFQPHCGYEETVNDIERAQLQIHFALDGQHQFTGDDVVSAVLVAGIEADGVAEGGTDELWAALAVGGIGTGIVKVPLELLRN